MEERTEVTSEVRDILRNADHPMNTQEIFNECVTAEDMREVAHSIHLLTKDGSIERRPVVNKEPAHRYQMPGRWPIDEPEGSTSDERFNGGRYESGQQKAANKKASKKKTTRATGEKPTKDEIMGVIEQQKGEFRSLDLAIALGNPHAASFIGIRLCDFLKQGLVERVSRGRYRKAGGPRKQEGTRKEDHSAKDPNVQKTETGEERYCKKCESWWPNHEDFFFRHHGELTDPCKACYYDMPSVRKRRGGESSGSPASLRPVPDVPPPKPDEAPPEPDPEPDLPPAAADDEDRSPSRPIHLGAERISVARCGLMSDGALFLELDDGRHFELDRESTELIDDHLAVWTAGVAFQSLEDIANA